LAAEKAFEFGRMAPKATRQGVIYFFGGPQDQSQLGSDRRRVNYSRHPRGLRQQSAQLLAAFVYYNKYSQLNGRVVYDNERGKLCDRDEYPSIRLAYPHGRGLDGP
jgi:hypothetical protein